MLKSMKSLPVKSGPVTPKLSPEAKTEMERKLINMKTRAEERKKAAEKALEPKIEPASYDPNHMDQDEIRRSIGKNLLYAKTELRNIKEREENDYGRNTPKGKDPFYNRQEFLDSQNKPSHKRSLEMFRKDARELPRLKPKQK